MKANIPVLAALLAAPLYFQAVAADSILNPLNDQLRGTVSGRVQTLGIYRDFDHGNNGHKTTLGTVIGYESPGFCGFDFGAAYNYAFTLFDGGNTALPLNDDINVINEGWLRYKFNGTSLTAGRRISNGEIFREDDYRQKARSIENLQLTTNDIAGLSLSAGHAIRLSNWIDLGDRWDFNNFGDVFHTGYDTDGVTWMEGTYSGFENWEIALFDAYAWDVTNLIGTRIQYNFRPEAALIGYYRHEGSVGQAAARSADACGVSYRQTLGRFTLEPGYFGVFGDSLRFQEATTGINHPLGVTMLLCGCQFEGGAQTAFIKASGKIGVTALYLLYSHTWQTEHPFDGQELNLVIKQPVTENLAVSLKIGLGYEDADSGEDTTFTDSRVFLTYIF